MGMDNIRVSWYISTCRLVSANYIAKPYILHAYAIVICLYSHMESVQ